MNIVGRRALILFALPILILAPLTWSLAHDMWIVPPETAKPGAPVEVALAVGMDFPHSTSAIAKERVSVRVYRPDGREAKTEVSFGGNADLTLTTARFTPETEGGWLVGAETKPSLIEMEARKFNAYLLHDGLAHVFEARHRADEEDEDGRERYSKYVKGLVRVGEGSGRAATRPIGQTLEIVPERDPLTAKLGETLAVRVLFRGQPLADANLCWDVPGNGAKFLGQTWTDDAGRALVPIARTGLTTLRLIHMTRPRAETHEWESFWASFTWRVAPR